MIDAGVRLCGMLWKRRGGRIKEGYDAFISYSHDADRRLAPVLHRALRRMNRKPLRVRAMRIFRDHENLAANPDLWAVVEGALARSRYFVLMASPGAVRSRWVRREIGYWQRNRDASSFLIAHTGGEIVWDQEKGDFDWERTTALPRQLKGWFPAQPGWVPLTWAEPGADLTLRNQRFRTAVCKLAGPIHGLDPDEIDSEDRRNQRRLNRISQAVSMILVVLLFIAGCQWKRAEREADAARHSADVAQDRLANLLAAESNTATVSRQDPRQALLFALTAVDLRRTDRTLAALHAALESQPHLTRILRGHTANKVIVSNPPVAGDGIRDLVYRPGTGELVSAGDDGRIFRWDPATGRRQLVSASQYTYRGGVFDVAISPDGTRLASSGTGSTAVWDLVTGKPAFGPDESLGRRGVAFDGDGRLQVRSCGPCPDGGTEFQSWEPGTWRQVSSVRLPRYASAFASSRTTMAGAGCLQNGVIANDGCTQSFIQLWHTGTGELIGEPLVAPGKEITAVDVSADATRIAAGTRDGRIQLWDTGSRRLLESWQGHTGQVRAIRFSPDGTRVATGGQDGRALVWNAAAVQERPRTFAAYNSAVTAVAFSPDGRHLATGDLLNTIMLWSLGADSHTTARFGDRESDPRSVAVSPDGKTIVLGGADGVLFVYDRDSRKVVRRFPVAPVCPHRRQDVVGPYHPCYLDVLRFSQDGGVLQVASSAGNIARWDTRTWTLLDTPLVSDAPCRSVVCDGRKLTTRSLAFSPDLILVAAGGNKRIWVWNARTHELVHTFEAHDGDVTSLAFSSDGRLLASGSADKTVLLWDLENGRPAGGPLRHDEEVTAVAFQPGQHRLASNAADRTVRIWDHATGQQIRSFRNDSENYAPELVFSSDGGHLATTTTNYGVALWETATWTALPRFRTAASLMALTFDPARRVLVTVAKGSGEKAPTYVSLHNHDPQEWFRRACAIVPRNLDHQSIEAYTTGKIEVCPGLPVDGSVVLNQLDIAQTRLNQKDGPAAAAAFRESARLATANDNDDAELAHLVCLTGVVSRHAQEVLDACDRAVELSPDSGPFHSARGIARAMTGDRTGAVEDLQAFVGWASSSGLFLPDRVYSDAGALDVDAVIRRREWITELAGGRDPFTPRVMSAIWREFLEDQGGNTYQTCPVDVGPWVEWVQRPTGC